MPSDLDRRFEEVVARLTAPGQSFATTRDAYGRTIVAGLPATLPEFFRVFCARHPQAEAIVAGGERLSYGAIDEASDRLARLFAGSFGIAKGDRVGIAMPNCPSWIVTYMAALKAGAIATLVNGWWQPAELEHALGLAEPVLVLADAERARRIGATAIAARVITLDIDQPLEQALAPLLTGAVEGRLPDIAANDDATILFTSGSTGPAKGAVSTHRQVTMAAYTYLTYLATLYELLTGGKPLEWAPSALVGLPLFHVTGEVPVMLVSFAIGRKMALMRKWDAGEALRLVERERVTNFVGVPTMSFEMARHPDRAGRDVSSLADIVAGGAPRPVAHVARLLEAFPQGHPMMGYGLTETNAVGCLNFRGNYIARPASTGPALGPFVELAILGEAAARHLPRGEVGEIGIRAAANVRGYWNDPEATRAGFTGDGYFRTGDLGYLDEDGYLFIVDRAKDIIIRGGENISSQEVEAAIYAHPAVAEAAVFGIPDERLGEVPAALVRLEPGRHVEVDALNRFLDGRLARFKLPARLWFSDEPLPRLGTGKIDKAALRHLCATNANIPGWR